ncbi:MAG: hypothetical protein JWP27_1039, partial [Flaviaesturariibacter sp.]|nr:hypothetical protein [Flaviaesturariibacter sp.]
PFKKEQSVFISEPMITNYFFAYFT